MHFSSTGFDQEELHFNAQINVTVEQMSGMQGKPHPKKYYTFLELCCRHDSSSRDMAFQMAFMTPFILINMVSILEQWDSGIFYLDICEINICMYI